MPHPDIPDFCARVTRVYLGTLKIVRITWTCLLHSGLSEFMTAILVCKWIAWYRHHKSLYIYQQICGVLHLYGRRYQYHTWHIVNLNPGPGHQMYQRSRAVSWSVRWETAFVPYFKYVRFLVRLPWKFKWDEAKAERALIVWRWTCHVGMVLGSGKNLAIETLYALANLK